MSKKAIVSNALIARTRQFALLGSAALMMLPGIVLAQGTGGTGGFGGTVPTTFSITDNTSGNSTLAGTLGAFSTLSVGTGSSLVSSNATPLTFRLRSNAAYKISAAVTSMTGMTDGTSSGASTTAQAIKTGDIGFGFTTAIDQTGLSVVGGGTSPSRTDSIVSGYDVTSGWASLSNGHTPSFTKTLHDIYSGTQILSGSRISSNGDNTSDDNFLVITLGVATLPQFFTPAVFTGVVTLTIASNP
jgi:hypothetical protein